MFIARRRTVNIAAEQKALNGYKTPAIRKLFDNRTQTKP